MSRPVKQCLAAGCKKSRGDQQVFCLSHWRMVLPATQAAIHSAYRRRDRVALRKAIREAIREIADWEGRP